MLRSIVNFQVKHKVSEILSTPSLIVRYKVTRYKRRSEATRKRLLREDASMEWAKPLFNIADAEKNKVKDNQNDTDKAKEPHMIHVVRRIATLYGRPWWEKDVIEKFGLTESMHTPVLVKNTPENNRLLQEVKHLVEIQPLTFPHGMPEHESDFAHSVINSKGEMIVRKRLKEETDSLSVENPRSNWQLDVDTIQTQLLRTRLNFDIHSEYHKTDYEYKRNQDGKEWRYKDFWKAVAERNKKTQSSS